MDRLTITQTMARFALSLQPKDIPQEVFEYGKLLLLDTFGVAMTNQDAAYTAAIRKMVREMRSDPRCTLWGSEEKASLADAVLFNAALIHGSDYDDTHVAAIVHPSAAVVSTAICAGEAAGATGEEIFTAIVAGWEIITRLGLAARGRFHDVGFHGTGIVAPFAAACVAAKLTGSSEEALVNALGICGSQAAGLQQFLKDGTWAKKIHPGWGAHSAVYALHLARSGFLGSPEVLEGEFGIWRTHCGGTDGLAEAFSDLGRVWRTLEITVKRYPVCHMTHSFADCMIRIMEENHLTVDEIASVECRIESRCYPIVCTPREVKVRPSTDYTMRFSLPYIVAMAALKGRVSPAEIRLEYARDPRLCELMDKIQCVDDNSKQNPGYFPGYVTVTLKDGRSFVGDQRYEVGTPQNPLNLDVVRRKFEDNLETVYPREQMEQIRETVERLAELPGVEKLLVALRVRK